MAHLMIKQTILRLKKVFKDMVVMKLKLSFLKESLIDIAVTNYKKFHEMRAVLKKEINIQKKIIKNVT